MTTPSSPATNDVLNSDHDEARALHRIVRAMHDGECPRCHNIVASTTMQIQYRLCNDEKPVDPEGWKCISCGFQITSEEADRVLQLFAPFMERNLAIFEAWRNEKSVPCADLDRPDVPQTTTAQSELAMRLLGHSRLTLSGNVIRDLRDASFIIQSQAVEIELLKSQTSDRSDVPASELAECKNNLSRCRNTEVFTRLSVVESELSAKDATIERLKRHNLIYEAAVARWINFEASCDYDDDETKHPLQCPGLDEKSKDFNGGWCHWCQLRGAVLGIDSADCPAEKYLAPLEPDESYHCIFCSFTGETLQSLKDHSAECEGHPLMAEVKNITKSRDAYAKGTENLFKDLMESRQQVQKIQHDRNLTMCAACGTGVENSTELRKHFLTCAGHPFAQEREKFESDLAAAVKLCDQLKREIKWALRRAIQAEEELATATPASTCEPMTGEELIDLFLLTAKANGIMQYTEKCDFGKQWFDTFDALAAHIRPQPDVPAETPPITEPTACTADCEDCGRQYGHEHGFPDLIITKDAWQQISPSKDDGGLLCPSCICKRLHEAGMRDVEGAFMSGPIKSVDPSLMHAIRWMENLRVQGHGWSCPKCGGGREQQATEIPAIDRAEPGTVGGNASVERSGSSAELGEDSASLEPWDWDQSAETYIEHFRRIGKQLRGFAERGCVSLHRAALLLERQDQQDQAGSEGEAAPSSITETRFGDQFIVLTTPDRDFGFEGVLNIVWVAGPPSQRELWTWGVPERTLGGEHTEAEALAAARDWLTSQAAAAAKGER